MNSMGKLLIDAINALSDRNGSVMYVAIVLR